MPSSAHVALSTICTNALSVSSIWCMIALRASVALPMTLYKYVYDYDYDYSAMYCSRDETDGE